MCSGAKKGVDEIVDVSKIFALAALDYLSAEIARSRPCF
jgi:hypothetical protein